jgi:hypothetical protein
MIFVISPHLNNSEGKVWLPIQKKFIEKHTTEEYRYIPLQIEDGTKHIVALAMCLEYIDKVASKGDLIIEMDSDSFPINNNWISDVKKYLDEGNEFVAVQRLENPRFYKDIAHPCFAAWVYGAEIKFDSVHNNPYIDGYQQRKWKPLHRTNKRDLHEQLYGCYGFEGKSIAFHAGCGSRIGRVSKDLFFRKGIRIYNAFFRNPEVFIQGLI